MARRWRPRDCVPSLFDELPKWRQDPSQLFLPSLNPANGVQPLMERLVDAGKAVLDRLHQATLLFGRSQTSLNGPLLKGTGMSDDPRFWRLAQSLSALYPTASEEKRWVDGVLARKKGLGFS